MAVQVMITDDGSTLGRTLRAQLAGDGVEIVEPRTFILEAKRLYFDVFPGFDKRERNYPSLKEGIRNPRIKKGNR